MRRTVRPNSLTNAERHWWHRLHLSTQKFAAVLVFTAFGLGFTYVWLTNQTAAQGFAIDELQQQMDGLQAQNEKLELQAADLRALSAVQVATEGLALEAANGFEVLRPVGGPVAIQP